MKPFFLRPNTQNYSESGSPFPDCREGLTDRLSNSVLLPGIEPWTGRKTDAAIEPWTGRKTDAAITMELVPDPSQWKEKKACSVAWGGFKTHASAASRLFLKPFFFRPNTQNYSESGSPFPDCRERLADRLSNSVLLPGVEPWTGRKTDAAITTELMPDPSQWKEKKLALSPGVVLTSTQVRMVSAPSLTCVGDTRPFLERLEAFFLRPNTQNFTDLPV